MRVGKKIPAFLKAGLCIFLLAGIASCQGSLTSYRGKPVEAKNRFDLLEGGSQDGDWQTRDIRVEFQYLREHARSADFRSGETTRLSFALQYHEIFFFEFAFRGYRRKGVGR